MGTASTGRPATLRTIAELAGIHASTVSRVLNTPGAASQAAAPETVARIRAIAADVGYRPNPHAASLRTRRSRTVGVLVPRLSDLVLATIYEGIEEAAAELGLSTFVANSYDDPQRRQDATEAMLDRRVEGMIFGDAELDGVFLDAFNRRNVPFVLVNRRAGDYPSVTCDDYEGGRLVAEHFLDLGHTDVAVLAGRRSSSTGRDRTAGFVDRFAEAGVRIDPIAIVPTAFDTRGGRKGMQEILAKRKPPAAVFAVNDFTAIGAMGAIRDHGLTVGRDVALAGYNDTALAAELPIALTTVRSPMRQMGQEAMTMLARLINGQTVQSHRLTPALVVRDSTAGETPTCCVD